MDKIEKYKNVGQAGRPGKTQARCLCYCQDGRDARLQKGLILFAVHMLLYTNY
jgi:hypothetical protein